MSKEKIIEELKTRTSFNNTISVMAKDNAITDEEELKILEKLYESFKESECNTVDDYVSNSSEYINFFYELQEDLEYNYEIEIRICSHCNKIMICGYIISGGDAYYCSDDCLNEHMTKKEFEEAYGNGDTDTYYTDWYEPKYS